MDGHPEDRRAGRSGERWLSVAEVGAYLGVSRDTVYRWLRDRNLPGHCLGRLWKFKQAEVDLWVQAVGNDRDGGRDG